MPLWLNSVCAAGNLSTLLLIVAVVAYLPNLYFNSNSNLFRRKKPSNEARNSPIAFTGTGVIVNFVISIMALAGIVLSFLGC